MVKAVGSIDIDIELCKGCDICIDVCPYVHKANRDPEKKRLYKQNMAKRKKAGYSTPAWFPEDEAKVMGDEPATS